jgi:hypothetical protein
MSKDKIKIVSLSLDPEMHEQIKSSARKLGHKNVSQVIRDLVSKYLCLLANDSDDVPVIIKIPSRLKDNPNELKAWLYQKSEAITKALT